MTMDNSWLQSALASMHLYPREDWLRTAVQFLSCHAYTETKEMLLYAILDQILHSNLCESVEVSTKIPPMAKKFVLTKPTIYQVISILNVGRSMMEQYREFTTEHNDLSWFHGDNGHGDDSEEHKSVYWSDRRELRVELTDGINFLQAFVAGPITQFDDIMPVGTKILVLHKIVLRNRIMILRSEDYQILGGDIESNKNENSHVEILAGRLGIQLKDKKEQSTSVQKKKANPTKSSGITLRISPFLIRTARGPQLSKEDCEQLGIAEPDVKPEAATEVSVKVDDDVKIVAINPTHGAAQSVDTVPNVVQLDENQTSIDNSSSGVSTNSGLNDSFDCFTVDNEDEKSALTDVVPKPVSVVVSTANCNQKELWRATNERQEDNVCGDSAISPQRLTRHDVEEIETVIIPSTPGPPQKQREMAGPGHETNRDGMVQQVPKTNRYEVAESGLETNRYAIVRQVLDKNGEQLAESRADCNKSVMDGQSLQINRAQTTRPNFEGNIGIVPLQAAPKPPQEQQGPSRTTDVMCGLDRLQNVQKQLNTTNWSPERTHPMNSSNRSLLGKKSVLDGSVVPAVPVKKPCRERPTAVVHAAAKRSIIPDFVFRQETKRADTERRVREEADRRRMMLDATNRQTNMLVKVEPVVGTERNVEEESFHTPHVSTAADFHLNRFTRENDRPTNKKQALNVLANARHSCYQEPNTHWTSNEQREAPNSIMRRNTPYIASWDGHHSGSASMTNRSETHGGQNRYGGINQPRCRNIADERFDMTVDIEQEEECQEFPPFHPVPTTVPQRISSAHNSTTIDFLNDLHHASHPPETPQPTHIVSFPCSMPVVTPRREPEPIPQRNQPRAMSSPMHGGHTRLPPMQETLQQPQRVNSTNNAMEAKVVAFDLRRLSVALSQSRFWMVSEVVNVQAIARVVTPLSVVRNDWHMEVELTDISGSKRMPVSAILLKHLLKFSVADCKRSSMQRDEARVTEYKRRIDEVVTGVERLDLIWSIRMGPTVAAEVVNVQTIPAALAAPSINSII